MTDTIVPQIDPVAVSGAPGTVTLPVTGHVLSLPQAGEGIMGYFQRTSTQTGANPQDAGFFALGGGAYGATGDQSTWPEAVDRLANPVAYMTPAQQQAIAHPVQVPDAVGPVDVNSLTMADKLYLAQNTSALSVIGGSHAAIVGAINTGAYSALQPNGGIIGPDGTAYAAEAVNPQLIAAVANAKAALATQKVARHAAEAAAGRGPHKH